MFNFVRSARAGAGRASDAVDDSVGTAVEDDTEAVAGVAFTILARRAVRSPRDVTIGSDEGEVTAGDARAAFGIGRMALGRPSVRSGFGFGAGFEASARVRACHCSASRAALACALEGAGLDDEGLKGEAACPPCAQMAATDVTMPPFPPRAERTSYLASGSAERGG